MHVWERIKHELSGRRLVWNLLCAPFPSLSPKFRSLSR